jgi:hypothetical protein
MSHLGVKTILYRPYIEAKRFIPERYQTRISEWSRDELNPYVPTLKIGGAISAGAVFCMAVNNVAFNMGDNFHRFLGGNMDMLFGPAVLGAVSVGYFIGRQIKMSIKLKRNAHDIAGMREQIGSLQYDNSALRDMRNTYLTFVASTEARTRGFVGFITPEVFLREQAETLANILSGYPREAAEIMLRCREKESALASILKANEVVNYMNGTNRALIAQRLYSGTDGDEGYVEDICGAESLTIQAMAGVLSSGVSDRATYNALGSRHDEIKNAAVGIIAGWGRMTGQQTDETSAALCSAPIADAAVVLRSIKPDEALTLFRAVKVKNPARANELLGYLPEGVVEQALR